MYKIIAVVRRREGVSREAFADYWVNVHAPLVRTTLPGLRKYVLNIAEARDDGGDLDYDGVVELHYDDREAADRAMRSPEWLSASRQSSSDHFLDLGSIISVRATEYVVPLD